MTLRARLLAAFAYVMVLVLVALEIPLGLNLSRRVDAEIEAEAAGQAQLIAATAAGRLNSARELSGIATRATRQLGGRVIVVDRQGRLLADSAGSGLRSNSYASRPEVARALRGETAQGARRSASLGTDLLYTAVPVVRDGSVVGAVRSTQSVAAARAEVRRDMLSLVGIGAVALLLGLGVAWLLAGSLSRPLRALGSAARRIGGGDLDARAEVAGSTEQRELAEAFNEMAARVEKSLAAQRDFVANASHQLRTPLTGLRLRVEGAAVQTDDPDLRRELEAAEREAERLARLVTELLTLAAAERRPDMAEPADLGEAARAARERWSAPAERSGHVLTVAGPPGTLVRAPADDLATVLDNLVENALNYSPPGGEVAIEWEGGGTEARLRVLDRGPGPDPEEAERAFERFFRGAKGRSGGPGTGLGLSIVGALAERWGGTARLDERPGGGGRAEVVLPAEVRGRTRVPPEAVSVVGRL